MTLSGNPLITVVIPTYSRPDRLRSCLAALTAADYPRDRFEVIAVDDGSPEPPFKAIAEFSTHIRVRLIRQPHSGPAGARNRGAAEAHGRLLAFTDDDCAPTSTWLTAIERSLSVTPEHLIAGKVINALPKNPYSTASQLLIDYLVGYFNTDPSAACFVTSNNMALERGRFLSIGGFSQAFPRAAGEDREFAYRWRDLGWPVSFRPEIVVRHSHALSLRTYCLQHFNYGRGAAQLRRALICRGSQPLPFEPWRFYRNLLSFPLRIRQQPDLAGQSALLALSQVANALGFVYERFLTAKPRGSSSTST